MFRKLGRKLTILLQPFNAFYCNLRMDAMAFANLKLHPEQSECIALSDWLKYHPKLKNVYFHIPNEGRRTRIYGWILKRMGLRKGVSDYFIAYPNKNYHGLFIEMKAQSKDGQYSKASPEQVIFMNHVIDRGYAGHFCNGFADAKSVIMLYMMDFC